MGLIHAPTTRWCGEASRVAAMLTGRGLARSSTSPIAPRLAAIFWTHGYLAHGWVHEAAARAALAADANRQLGTRLSTDVHRNAHIVQSCLHFPDLLLAERSQHRQ